MFSKYPSNGRYRRTLIAKNCEFFKINVVSESLHGPCSESSKPYDVQACKTDVYCRSEIRMTACSHKDLLQHVAAESIRQKLATVQPCSHQTEMLELTGTGGGHL